MRWNGQVKLEIIRILGITSANKHSFAKSFDRKIDKTNLRLAQLFTVRSPPFILLNILEKEMSR